jgi:lysophospholipase
LASAAPRGCPEQVIVGRKEFLRGLDTPILLASAGLETFVLPESHRRAARLLPDCTLVEFPDSKHEPFLERDPIRNDWLEAIDRFVAERVVRTSPDYRRL